MLKKYKLRSYNFILVFILIVTSVFALAVVNSANSAYTMKQGAGMVVSFIIMFIVSFIDYNWILKYFWIWYGVVTVMLIRSEEHTLNSSHMPKSRMPSSA